MSAAIKKTIQKVKRPGRRVAPDPAALDATQIKKMVADDVGGVKPSRMVDGADDVGTFGRKGVDGADDVGTISRKGGGDLDQVADAGKRGARGDLSAIANLFKQAPMLAVIAAGAVVGYFVVNTFRGIGEFIGGVKDTVDDVIVKPIGKGMCFVAGQCGEENCETCVESMVGRFWTLLALIIIGVIAYFAYKRWAVPKTNSSSELKVPLG